VYWYYSCHTLYGVHLKKHKDYSLSDQQQATSDALGGAGAPDIQQLRTDEKSLTKRTKRLKKGHND
jgi:hypothetical protein